MVGAGDAARIEALAGRHGVAGRLRLLGRRADVERWYQAADLFVFPTAYEAFPLVGLEAAASALPLVATAVNGIEDLVQDGDAGLLVEPGRGGGRPGRWPSWPVTPPCATAWATPPAAGPSATAGNGRWPR